jgi:CRISPR-associated exonuclease Cas4
VLGIEEHEEKRGTVKAGKLLHENKSATNINYIFKAVGNGRKLNEQILFSNRLRLVGKIDQIIINQKIATVVEFKHSYGYIGKTLLVQLGLQSILIKECLHKICNTGYVEFVTSNQRKLLKIKIDTKIRKIALDELEQTRIILEKKTMPFSIYNGRCVDCQYRNICPVGILKRPL